MANFIEQAQTGPNGEIMFNGGAPNMNYYGGGAGMPNHLMNDFEFASMIQTVNSNISDVATSETTDNSGSRAAVKQQDISERKDLIEIYTIRMDTATISHQIVNYFKAMFADVESATVNVVGNNVVATIYFNSTYVPKEIDVDGKKMTEPIAFASTINTKVNDPMNQLIQMQTAANAGVMVMSKEAKAIFGGFTIDPLDSTKNRDGLIKLIDVTKCTSRIYDTMSNKFVAMVTNLDLVRILMKIYKIGDTDGMKVLVHPKEFLLDDSRQRLYSIDFINGETTFKSDLKVDPKARAAVMQQQTMGYK